MTCMISFFISIFCRMESSCYEMSEWFEEPLSTNCRDLQSFNFFKFLSSASLWTGQLFLYLAAHGGGAKCREDVGPEQLIAAAPKQVPRFGFIPRLLTQNNKATHTHTRHATDEKPRWCSVPSKWPEIPPTLQQRRRAVVSFYFKVVPSTAQILVRPAHSRQSSCCSFVSLCETNRDAGQVMRRRQPAGLWGTSCTSVRGLEAGGGSEQVRQGASPSGLYLAHLPVLSGQLVPRIICSNGKLILVLLITCSVGPLLRGSEGD